jgi:hypothetical protein
LMSESEAVTSPPAALTAAAGSAHPKTMTEPVGVVAAGEPAADAPVAVAKETPTVARAVMAARTRRLERDGADMRLCLLKCSCPRSSSRTLNRHRANRVHSRQDVLRQLVQTVTTHMTYRLKSATT